MSGQGNISLAIFVFGLTGEVTGNMGLIRYKNTKTRMAVAVMSINVLE